ncbi:26S proteasome non-ATPase regulatory subunit 14 homolog isoform X1 [Vitis vinifera]|uniref:26S proteasome non-ATPase regulatory subunit 14 homolog isoform X1 n=1 Tax=Vitis vinifera TaxID=29760 RepID=UPI00288304E5|nr:26S proteasome non-ATPase regulatory subunit 14 homolog isoform X1 [Vitis vinifera]
MRTKRDLQSFGQEIKGTKGAEGREADEGCVVDFQVVLYKTRLAPKEKSCSQRNQNPIDQRETERNREKARGNSEMERLQRMFAGAGGALGHPPPDSPTLDSSEQVYISSLALLKMLKHGRAGVPMEVMGLMLGEFVDEYTVRVVDVFAMPQSGTGVSVEAVDHVFQTNMLDMLKQTGRPEMVVGWYHSHPGFGCWLSGVDINTQQSFEALNQRAVAVVVDPIQSVKGKVVIDAFRLINPQTMMLGQEPRQTTSNLGHLNKPSIQALIHGLNRHYYSIAINYRKNELEEKMLLNLHKKKWTDGLTLKRFDTHSKTNEQTVQVSEGFSDFQIYSALQLWEYMLNLFLCCIWHTPTPVSICVMSSILLDVQIILLRFDVLFSMSNLTG